MALVQGQMAAKSELFPHGGMGSPELIAKKSDAPLFPNVPNIAYLSLLSSGHLLSFCHGKRSAS